MGKGAPPAKAGYVTESYGRRIYPQSCLAALSGGGMPL